MPTLCLLIGHIVDGRDLTGRTQLEGGLRHSGALLLFVVVVVVATIVAAAAHIATVVIWCVMCGVLLWSYS